MYYMINGIQITFYSSPDSPTMSGLIKGYRLRSYDAFFCYAFHLLVYWNDALITKVNGINADFIKWLISSEEKYDLIRLNIQRKSLKNMEGFLKQ